MYPLMSNLSSKHPKYNLAQPDPQPHIHTNLQKCLALAPRYDILQYLVHERILEAYKHHGKKQNMYRGHLDAVDGEIRLVITGQCCVHDLLHCEQEQCPCPPDREHPRRFRRLENKRPKGNKTNRVIRKGLGEAAALRDHRGLLGHEHNSALPVHQSHVRKN